MLTLLHIYLLLLAVTLIYGGICFGLSILLKRNDIADVAWGLGFILVSVVSFLKHDFNVDRGLVATTLVCLWGLRLSFHIAWRNRKRGEDFRYAAWRKEWGKSFLWRSYVQIYLLQGLLMLCVVTPVVICNVYRDNPFTALDAIAVMVWGIGFVFESVGDWQLLKFSQNPENRGQIITTGLWRYSRHPNYFGEVTQWWGLGVLALSTPYGIVGLIGPVVITVLILKVSGIPMLEKKYENHLNFQKYKQKTSAFFPWPPKK